MSGRFWWVFNTTTKGQPAVRHATVEKAHEEAIRLARKCPGENFVVLESVASYRAEKPIELPVVHTEHRAPDHRVIFERPRRWATGADFYSHGHSYF